MSVGLTLIFRMAPKRALPDVEAAAVGGAAKWWCEKPDPEEALFLSVPSSRRCWSRDPVSEGRKVLISGSSTSGMASEK